MPFCWFFTADWDFVQYTVVLIIYSMWWNSSYGRKIVFFGTNSVNMSENFKPENSWFSNFWCWQLTTCQTIVQYQIIKIFFYFWGLLTLAAKFQTKLNLSNSHGEHKFCSRIEVLKPTSVLGSFPSNPSKMCTLGWRHFDWPFYIPAFLLALSIADILADCSEQAPSFRQ